MLLDSIEHTGYLSGAVNPSGELVKVNFSGGTSFYTRLCYLPPEMPNSGSDVSDEMLSGIIEAGQCYLAERYALECLARLEYSRYQLSIKLAKKEFKSPEVKKTLDFLEKISYLDDKRFAESWIRFRVRKYPEGKSKLLSGLLSHGVSKNIASAVVDEFLKEQPEQDLLERAYEKLRRSKKSDTALARSLLAKGFSMSAVERCVDVRFF